MNTNDTTFIKEHSSSKRHWLKLGLGSALVPLLAAHSTAIAAKSGPRSNYFPNVVVNTHEGKKLRFYDDVVHGKIVVFNMMYSVCTGICPGNTANLLRVQEALGNQVGKDIFMVSMTLQPTFDTPDALRDYVKRYGIQPGWTFLTGKPDEMENIRRKLGFFNPDPAIDSQLGNHTGMLRIGNEALDRWFMMPALSPPEQIAHAIRQL